MSVPDSESFSEDFGAKLLNEVLSHFTCVNPDRLNSRDVKKAQPKVSAWSNAQCIQRRPGSRGQGMVRKYQVNVADRGQNSCHGRPGPSPSPSPPSPYSPVQSPSPLIWLEGSDQTEPLSPDQRMCTPPLWMECVDSRPGSGVDSGNSRAQSPTCTSPVLTRDRLPKSSQQFPVLAASGWTTRSMMNRAAVQQSQCRDTPINSHAKKPSVGAPSGEEKPPFKHHAKPELFGLFRRKFGSADCEGRHADESEAHHSQSSKPGRTANSARDSSTSSPSSYQKTRRMSSAYR